MWQCFRGLVATGILCATQLVHAEPAPVPESPGRYEGVAASANAVWVIDTHTGRVRRCTQEFADQTPSCSAYSN